MVIARERSRRAHISLVREPCYAAGMGDDRVIELIGRIDRALSRIETAVDRPAPPPPDDRRTASLEQAHQVLRGRVKSAIAQIDRLIASGENS